MSAPDAGALGRRQFVGACLCAIGCGLLGACASLVTRVVTPVEGQLRLALTHYPELTEPGGAIKVLPEGADEPVYVLALAEGGFAALSPICTHLGCTVEIEGARLVCPCHGSTYDREGNVLEGPAELPLDRFRTTLGPDGVLVIDLRRRV